MILPMEPLEDDEDRPSKSARKREALALQKLGEALIALKEADLTTLDLPENVAEAVREARRITSRGGGARQRQYIGRLMRTIDPAPIRLALEALNRNPSHHRAAKLG
jgi:ribosome-associated protein